MVTRTSPSITLSRISLGSPATGDRSRFDRESGERNDRGRTHGKPHGRYDGRSSNTRLPPGAELGTLPRDAVRRRVETNINRIRVAMRKTDDPRELQRLHDERARFEASVEDRGETDATIAAVIDPLGRADERILVTVNKRVDILERERARGLISEAAYRTGRDVQLVLERSMRVSGTNWAGTSRIDAGEAKELGTIRTIVNAKEARAMEDRIRLRLGVIGARLFRRIVGDGMSYAQCAALIGKAGPKGEEYIAKRFREAIEDLAEAWTSKGRAQPTPDDKHLAASLEAINREDGAIAGGATLLRLEAELRDAVRDPKRRIEAVALASRIDRLREIGSRAEIGADHE